MEQNMQDMPQHIVNGFSFNDASAKLMAYALDMKRLGANIDQNFWDTRIVEDSYEQSMTDLVLMTGPILHRRNFDMFETIERCRKNAAVVFEALIYGFDLLMQELREAFLEESGASPFIRRHDTNMFSTDLIQYLSRGAEKHDLSVLERSRVQATVLCDAEPVLLSLSVYNETQYVWNGEWRALLLAPIDVRRRHIMNWYFNHAFTLHRLRRLTTAYLYHKFPEQFGGKSA